MASVVVLCVFGLALGVGVGVVAKRRGLTGVGWTIAVVVGTLCVVWVVQAALA